MNATFSESPQITVSGQHPPAVATRYWGIQSLRFYAAVAVLVYHCMHYLGLSTQTQSALWYLGIYLSQGGVLVFFAISGFVLTMSAQRKGPLSFLRARLLRLYPSYWAGCALVLVAKFIAFHTIPKVGETLTAISLLPLGSRPYPLGVEWTLIYELFFSFLFSALLCFGARRLPYLSILWLCVIIVYHHVTSGAATQFLPLFPSIALSAFNIPFILGVLVYGVHARLPLYCSRIVYPLALLFSVLSLLPSYTFWRVSFMAIAAALVVAGVARSALGEVQSGDGKGTISRWGDYSYGIYLMHVPIITFMVAPLLRANLPIYGTFLIVLGLGLSGALLFGRLEYALYRRLLRLF